jgi:hypothetical protein
MSKGFFFYNPGTRHFSPVFGPPERHQFFQFRHQKPTDMKVSLYFYLNEEKTIVSKLFPFISVCG